MIIRFPWAPYHKARKMVGFGGISLIILGLSKLVGMSVLSSY